MFFSRGEKTKIVYVHTNSIFFLTIFMISEVVSIVLRILHNTRVRLGGRV